MSDFLLFARITCSQLSQKCMQKYICRPNLGKPECRERLIVMLAENAVAADRRLVSCHDVFAATERFLRSFDDLEVIFISFRICENA